MTNLNTSTKTTVGGKSDSYAAYPELKEIRQDFIDLKKETVGLAVHLKDDGLSGMGDIKDYVICAKRF